MCSLLQLQFHLLRTVDVVSTDCGCRFGDKVVEGRLDVRQSSWRKLTLNGVSCGRIRISCEARMSRQCVVWGPLVLACCQGLSNSILFKFRLYSTTWKQTGYIHWHLLIRNPTALSNQYTQNPFSSAWSDAKKLYLNGYLVLYDHHHCWMMRNGGDEGSAQLPDEGLHQAVDSPDVSEVIRLVNLSSSTITLYTPLGFLVPRLYLPYC